MSDLTSHYTAVDALRDDLIARFGDDWHDMTIADIASAALDILNGWSVKARMSAMGMEVCSPTSEDDPAGAGACGEHFDGKHWVEA